MLLFLYKQTNLLIIVIKFTASLELELQIVIHSVSAGTQAHPLREQQVILNAGTFFVSHTL